MDDTEDTEEYPVTLYAGNPLDSTSIASKFLVEIWGGKEIIQVQINGLVTYTFDVAEAEELEHALQISILKWRATFRDDKKIKD